MNEKIVIGTHVWVVADQSVLSAEVTEDAAAHLLAKLLEFPVEDVRICEQAERAVMLFYTPKDLVDPDMPLVFFPAALPVNRAIVAFQNARILRVYSWKVETWNVWRARVNEHLEGLKATLLGSPVTAVERSFVLAWAQRIVDRGRTITDVVVTNSL